jgi:hypothetical protein
MLSESEKEVIFMNKKQTFFSMYVSLFVICLIVLFISCPAFAIEQKPNKKVIKRCEDLSGFQRNLCMEINKKRESLIKSATNVPKKTYLSAKRKNQKPFNNIANLVSSYKGKAELICKVPIKISKLSHSVCMRTATLISHLSEDGARIAMNDLNLLTDKFALMERVVAKCANGKWISVSGGSVSLNQMIQNGALTDFLQAELTTACGSAGQGAGSSDTGQSGQSQPGSGRSSGISGIDVNPFCQFGLPNIDVDKFAENALKHLEETKKQCQSKLIDMVKEEGGDDTPDPSDPDTHGTSDPSGVDAGLTQTTKDNGDGTVTVCTEYGCYVRYKTTTDTFKATNTTANGKKGVTVNNEGEDSNGVPMGEKTEFNFKGAGKWRDYVWDGENGWIPAGSGTNKDYIDKHPLVLVGIPNTCATDDACTACKSFLENEAALAEDCRKAGQGVPDSGLCAAYGNAIGCCGSHKGPKPDPTVLMPNPDGGITCYGISIDTKKDLCSKKCSVASTDVDCNSECMNNEVSTFPFNWFDRACQQMTSEEKCFSSPGISLPGRLGNKPGPQGPQPPSPPTGSSYFVF